jgi:hypothetical protein
MFSNYRSGLKRWSRTFQEIWVDSKVAGIEKWARRFLYFLRILSISEHLSFFIIGTNYSRKEYRRDLWITDLYVVGKTIFVALLAFLPERLLAAGAWIVSYLLAEMYLALLNVVFVRTLPNERPISIPRSLLLLILNAFQIIVTFALYYRIVLSLDPGAAIASSFQVFGTVGHPARDSGHGSYLVALQIALDFVFIAILLASFVGQAANAGPDQSSK